MTHTEFEARRKAAGRKNGVGKALTYLALSVWAVVVLFPFYWMVLTSLKSYGAYNSEHVPAFFTLSPTLENYEQAFTAVPLGGYLLNTLIFAVITTAVMVVVSTLAAGLVGGPIPGLCAGLLGGVHRFFYDPASFTSLACGVGTFCFGVVGAIAYGRMPQKKGRNMALVLLVVLSELLQSVLIFLFSRPFSAALAL